MRFFWGGLLAAALSSAAWGQHALVLQSDFGTQDGAVAAMKGVAVGVSADLAIHDLTHEIPVFNVWEAALRLQQTVSYWPAGTVFVSVVDPGVGTKRKSVVLQTDSGHYFVTPDNGTLTFVARDLGVAAVREIDEAVNRRRDSSESYTFHGRDVYVYTGARLAAGTIAFEEVGPLLPPQIVAIPHELASVRGGVVSGNIPILDIRFGNVWTNIDRPFFDQLAVQFGERVKVTISNADGPVYEAVIPYVETFGGVAVGDPLLYFNSLNKVALALNQGNFAKQFGIGSGHDWKMAISRP